MSEEDFDNFDKILKDLIKRGLIKIYLAIDNFEDFKESVLVNTLELFVNEYKMDIPQEMDDEVYMSLYDNLIDLYYGLIPYFEEKYHDELYDYFISNKTI